MPLLLIIDSAFEDCSVALCNNEAILAHAESTIQKNHAAFLQFAIKDICAEISVSLSEISAVAVTNGPGSFTGLRVGLSTAKGICYALQKPLILLNSLHAIAFALHKNTGKKNNVLYCPMIDARRLEVYTALYDEQMNIVKEDAAVVLDEFFLQEERQTATIIAGGNGSSKLKMLPGFDDIVFGTNKYSLHHLAIMATSNFKMDMFANLAYSEPFYVKPAYIK